jgi:hypothetical protein
LKSIDPNADPAVFLDHQHFDTIGGAEFRSAGVAGGPKER